MKSQRHRQLVQQGKRKPYGNRSKLLYKSRLTYYQKLFKRLGF